MIKVVKIGF